MRIVEGIIGSLPKENARRTCLSFFWGGGEGRAMMVQMERTPRQGVSLNTKGS